MTLDLILGLIAILLLIAFAPVGLALILLDEARKTVARHLPPTRARKTPPRPASQAGEGDSQ